MSIAACSPQTVTPGVVVFDPAAFVSQYPSFSTVSAAALQNNFNTAVLQLDNSCCSSVQDAPTRQVLLDLLTAHITALLNGVNGQPPAGTVGRISAATQGSVNMTVEWSTNVSDSQAYYLQTPWGAQFWVSTARFRAARYVAPCGQYSGGFDGWNAWPQ